MCAADESPSAANSEPVDYLRDIRPILRGRCSTCHNEADPGGGLRLDGAAHVMAGGDSGPIVVPGKSHESRLMEAVLQTGDLKMPPPDEGKPLEPAQIDLLRRWIDQGARVPDDETLVSHWSFQKPVRATVPGVDGSVSATNPIDAFIYQSLKTHDLHPLGSASKNVLLRRVYLDLIGLPPTPEQLAAFENDESADAYEKVVDELLASPHYGERWGRHWMDVWRYSDWDGYGAEVRESKPHIWRWRDWIIESLNEDKSYDQMIVEMLAADEASPNDSQALRATGFLVRNWYLFNRNSWIDNTIEHTGKAFMGVTFNCARCHDHMYDPISQSDYYHLRAVFEPHDVRTDRVPGQSDVAKDGLVRVYDANAATQTLLFVRGDEKNPLKDKPLDPKVPAVFAAGDLSIQPVELPATSFYPGAQDFVAAEALNAAESEMKTASAAELSARKTLEAAQSQLQAFQETAAESVAPAVVFSDDFSVSRPDAWMAGAGNWVYQNSVLTQLDSADTMCAMKMQAAHPTDVSVRLGFRVTGGEMYQSVGIAFDATDDQNFSFVYASAGSSKLQIAHRVNGADQYPPAGMTQVAVPLNQDHELQVNVRGMQVEVTLNGSPPLTYTLPTARPANGHLHIWTYDATAEFRSLEVTNATAVSEATLMTAVRQAEFSQQQAEKKLVVAVATLEFSKARIAADQANYSQPPAADAKERSLAAGKAEKLVAVRQEELKQLMAEHALAAAKAALSAEGMPADEVKTKGVTDAEAALAAVSTALEAAKKAAAEPFEAYTRFTAVYPSSSTGRRLALARWIASPENPLTARVAVNHLWLRHFHQPMVSTVFDFGMNGKPASHPELLDWLACELMENGWKMKPLHRMMLTSRAYQMSSSPGPEDLSPAVANAAKDPENRQLWRQNSYRMEAEIVRDATFHVAGQLDRTMSGPDLDPATGLTLGRRSVYFRTSKEKKMTFLSTFDSANPVECYQRPESISPQQSLAMSNSPLTLAQSRILATRLSEKVSAQSPADAASAFVRLAFQTVLVREPTELEQQECVHFLEQQSERFRAGSTLTTFTGGVENANKPSADPVQRARENLVHVLFNHNDFVTVR